jgi:hypothetical protein
MVRYGCGMSRDAWITVAVLGVVAVATLVGAVLLVIRLVRTRKLLDELGASSKFAFYGALIYTVFPLDLLPDPIYLDDMGVLAAALIFLTRQVHKHRAIQRPAPMATPRRTERA